MGYKPDVKGSPHSLKYRKFRRRLVNARKEADLTQAQVAEILGQHQSYVSKSESGERRVDAVELAEFAKIYRKSLGFFVGEE